MIGAQCDPKPQEERERKIRKISHTSDQQTKHEILFIRVTFLRVQAKLFSLVLQMKSMGQRQTLAYRLSPPGVDESALRD